MIDSMTVNALVLHVFDPDLISRAPQGSPNTVRSDN